jgi:hypothetical protein
LKHLTSPDFWAHGYWSVRIGRSYRALGKQLDDGILWGWIGSHAEYE